MGGIIHSSRHFCLKELGAAVIAMDIQGTVILWFLMFPGSDVFHQFLKPPKGGKLCKKHHQKTSNH